MKPEPHAAAHRERHAAINDRAGASWRCSECGDRSYVLSEPHRHRAKRHGGVVKRSRGCRSCGHIDIYAEFRVNDVDSMELTAALALMAQRGRFRRTTTSSEDEAA